MTQSSGGESYVLSDVATATYAIRSTWVQQVEMVEHVTPLPGAPPFIDGVVLTRGQVIPAVNMRVRLGFERTPYTTRTRLIVLGVSGRSVGFIVDGAREFVQIPAKSVGAPHSVITDVSDRYVEGIATLGERIVIILNVDEIAAFRETNASVVTE
jgi:purine-binding chemotaxis protein CheW